MDVLKVEEWIALVGAIATLMATIIVLLTLFEMMKQRKQSYMPDIVISDVCFNYESGLSTFADIWTMDDKDFLSLKVHNIGLWAAKDINFRWHYDMHEMIERFYKISKEGKGEIEIDSDDRRLFYKKNGETLSACSLSIDNSHFEFLLPCRDEKDYLKLSIPNSYITIATAFYEHVSIQELVGHNDFDFGLSPMELIATYKDIGGRLLEKRFNVQIKFFTKSIRLYHQDVSKRSMRGRVYVSEG